MTARADYDVLIIGGGNSRRRLNHHLGLEK